MASNLPEELCPRRGEYSEAIAIDDEPALEIFGHADGGGASLHIRSVRGAELIGQYSAMSVLGSYRAIHMPSQGLGAGLDYSFDLFAEQGEWHAEVYVWLGVKEWRRPYSFRPFFEAVQKLAPLEIPLSNFSGDPSGFSWEVVLPQSPDMSLEDVIGTIRVEVETLLTRADTSLSIPENALFETFAVPEAMQAACVQYLSYFTQFLRDLGVEADEIVESRPGTILFTVTPRDSSEALTAIREALTAYLNLPRHDVSSYSDGGNGSLAADQLVAQVLHLQSQLVMTRAALHAQSRAIEAQAITIETLRGGALQAADSHSEPLVGDIVKVSRFEKAGVTVDLASLLRRLKRRFD